MQIDEFESQFKSALKEPYRYSPIEIQTVLVVSDLNPDNAAELVEIVKRTLPSIGEKPAWHLFHNSDYHSVRDLLGKIEQLKPDLIIAQRSLKTNEENLVYGLSDYIDALTQVIEAPVMLLPDLSIDELTTKLPETSDVLLETNHITGDSNLINWGLRFTLPSDKLFLSHIEDDAIFSYYIDVISKIPEINTDLAEVKLKEMLLKLPTDFIQSVREVLKTEVPDINIEGIVRLGHRLEDYQAILDSHQIDLLIINTKVDGQLAMGGLAHAIGVEFKSLPLLLL